MAEEVPLRAGLAQFTRAIRPSKVFRGESLIAIGGGATSYWSWSLGGIPDGAIILDADLEVQQEGAWPAPVTSRSLTAQATGSWRAATLSHDNAPNAYGVTATTSRTVATADNTRWSIGVTAIVQAMVNGPSRNRGFFKITTNDGTNRWLSGRAVLTISYATLPTRPTGLHPNGAAVGTARPWLQVNPGSGVTGLRVQVATTSTFAAGTVVWTSDWTNGNARDVQVGVDLTAGTTYFWRAQFRSEAGQSLWSGVATFPYVPHIAVTVLEPQPGQELNDGTPLVRWSIAGGVQGSYRVVLVDDDAAKRILFDTEQKGSAGVRTVEPTSGFTKIGQDGHVIVDVWEDGVARASTSGDPIRRRTVIPVTFTGGAITPVSNITFSTHSHPHTPWRYVEWDRDELPDEWVILVNGVIVRRIDGQVAATATPNHYRASLFTLRPFTTSQVAVRAVRNGVVGNTGPTASVTPRCAGVYLVDPENGKWCALAGRNELSGSSPSDVFESTPLNTGVTVIRETNMAGFDRAIDHQVTDLAGRTAQQHHDQLMEFKRLGRPLRVAYAHTNKPVTLAQVHTDPVRAGVQDQLRWNVTGRVVQAGELDWAD